MATSTIRQLLSLSILLAALAACTSPTPRGYAQEGTAYDGTRNSHNAAYYQGADPTYHRQRSGGGP